MTSTMPIASASMDIIQKMNYPTTILIFTQISECNPFIEMLAPHWKLINTEPPTTTKKPIVVTTIKTVVTTTLIDKQNITKRDNVTVFGTLYTTIKEDSPEITDRLTTTNSTRTSEVQKVVSKVITDKQTYSHKLGTTINIT
jgi:hypothetical protein